MRWPIVLCFDTEIINFRLDGQVLRKSILWFIIFVNQFTQLSLRYWANVLIIS
jgi:hypothetical protein